MDALYYRQWRDQHLEEDFPFVGSGEFFPDNIFVDLSISVYGSVNIYLTSIRISSDLSGTLEDERENVYTFSHTLFDISSSSCDILDVEQRVRGKIVFGRNALDSINELTSSLINIPYGSVRVVSSCIFTFHVNQASGLTIGNNTYRGDINLVEGDGIKITGSNNNIIINAVGKKTPDDCCIHSSIVLKTINSRPPINGQFYIKPRVIEQPTTSTSPRQLIRITPIENGIELTLAT
jgi:hypothetical protein